MSEKTGGATETPIKPGDSSKAIARDLTGSPKDALTNGSLVALVAAKDALRADAGEVDVDAYQQAQFYTKAEQYVDAAINEVTWALEAKAAADAAEG